MNAIKLMLYLICMSLLATAVCGVDVRIHDEDNNLLPTNTISVSGNYHIDYGTYSGPDPEGDGAIIINSGNVILDCNDARITGTGMGQGIVGYNNAYPLNMQQLMEATDNLNNPVVILENMDLFISSIAFLENVTIKNCNINSYGNGINMTAFKNMTLSNNNMSNNTNGIYIFIGYWSNVSNNIVYNNTNGIYSISINTSLSNNTAYDNTGVGIINGGIGSNSSYNNVHENGLGIASVGFYNKVFGNNASGNGRSGNIKGGILAFGGNSTEIFNNIANYNNQSGIAMVATADVKVYNNTANFNDYGISVGGFLQGGESYLLNISNNTAWYSMKAGILLSDATFEKMLRAAMTGDAAGAGHVIRDSYIVGNDLLNNGASDLYIDDSIGGHISNNLIGGNNFNGGGVCDNYPLNNDYNDNDYSESASNPDLRFAINGITMFVSQEGSFLDGKIDVIDVCNLDNDHTCGWYNNGGLGELVVNPDCTITSNESIDYFWRNGTYTPTNFFVKDPEFGEKTKDTSITVANTNRAPVITGVDFSCEFCRAEQGKILQGLIDGYDPDGDLRICSLISSTLPEAKVDSSCLISSDSFLPPDETVSYTITVKMTDGTLEDTFPKEFEVQRPPYAPIIVNGSKEYNYFLYPERIEGQTVKFNVSLNLSLTSNGDPNQDDSVIIFSLNLPRNAIFKPYPNTPALMNFTWKIPCDEVDIGSYTEDPPGSGNTFIIYTIDFQTNDSHGAYGPPASVGVKIWNNTICNTNPKIRSNFTLINPPYSVKYGFNVTDDDPWDYINYTNISLVNSLGVVLINYFNYSYTDKEQWNSDWYTLPAPGTYSFISIATDSIRYYGINSIGGKSAKTNYTFTI